MTERREKEVIQSVLDGDVNAFEELVVEYKKVVYNIALKITRNENDALDISQEAFIKAFTRLGQFMQTGHFSMWICRLTNNLAIDFLRKKAREHEHTIPFLVRDSEDEEYEIPIADPAESPEERAINKELADEIVKCIDEFPDETRALLIMRDVNGLTYAEIAGILGLSEGTVKSRISRNRKKLLEMLQKRGTILKTDRLIKGT